MPNAMTPDLFDFLMDTHGRFMEGHQGRMDVQGITRHAQGDHDLPYDSMDGLLGLHRTALAIHGWNATAAHVHSSLVGASIGDGDKEKIEYECFPLREKGSKKTEKGAKELAKSLQQDLDRFQRNLKWYREQERFLFRYFFPGEVVRRINYPGDETRQTSDDKGGEFRLEFLRPECLKGVGQPKYIARYRQAAEAIGRVRVFDLFAKLGLILDVTEGKPMILNRPNFFLIWADPRGSDKFMEPVEAKFIQHVKNGADEDDPRGYSPYTKVWCNATGQHDIRTYAREMVLARTSHSVVEYVRSGAKGIHRLLGQEARAANKGTSDAPKQVRYAKGAKRFTKSEKVELPNLNLSADDIRTFVELDELQIGRVVSAPDYITLGKSDIGNKNTTDNTSAPWHTQIRRVQRLVKMTDVDIFWRFLAVLRGWDEAEVREMQEVVQIEAHLPDPERDLTGTHQRVRELFDRGAVGVETLNEVNGRNHMVEQERICRETETLCADALAVRFGRNGNPRATPGNPNPSGQTGQGNGNPGVGNAKPKKNSNGELK